MTIWPTRVAWPRREDRVLPALATLSPTPAPYARRGGGRSRFTLSPLHLGYDQLLFLVVAALLAVGLVMVQSADTRIHGTGEWPLGQNFGNKNMIHAGIALGAMLVVWRLDYRWLLGRSLRWSPAIWLIVLTVGSLVAVLATPLGKEINGARRWLGAGPVGFQPSELAKLGMVLFIAAYAVHAGERIRKFWTGYVPLVAVFGVVAALIVKEDFGTTALVGVVAFALIAMGGSRWWHVAMLVPPAAGIVWALIFRDPTSFRYRRFMAFWHPYDDPKGVGYHTTQSLLTIKSGGFWGLGLGNGIQKMGYLPEDNTDFIFAVICEELGFFGALIVLGLFVAFVFCGWRIASRCNNLFGKMVAFGITATIGLQAAMNVAVVTVTMPTKGIALPLVSSGGTGWIMTAVAVGVLMSIERINQREAAGVQTGSGDAPPAWGFPVETIGETSPGTPPDAGSPGAPPESSAPQAA